MCFCSVFQPKFSTACVFISGTIMILYFHFQSILVFKLFSDPMCRYLGSNRHFSFFFRWGLRNFLVFVFFVGGSELLAGRVHHASCSPMVSHGSHCVCGGFNILSPGTVGRYHYTTSTGFCGPTLSEKCKLVSALKIQKLFQILMNS